MTPADISGRPAAADTSIATAITLLTTESLAIIQRGLPAAKLTARPATLTASISAASPFTRRSRANPATDRTAGSTLLAASDSTRLTPNPSRSR